MRIKSLQLMVVLGTLLFAAADLVIAQAKADKADRDAVNKFMRAKLDHAKSALEGITLEDFSLIAKSADRMTALSEAAFWQAFHTPEYVHLSNQFRVSAAALKKAASQKNLDGATLAYMKLTLRCVECHKHVRGLRVARGELPELGRAHLAFAQPPAATEGQDLPSLAPSSPNR